MTDDAPGRLASGTVATAVAGALFVAGVGAAAAWKAVRSPPGYVPGEPVEGVVSQLSREVPKGYPSARFTDVTARAGIDFRHFSGVRTSQLPEDMGSGLAWGDYNRDGYPDLYLVNSGSLGASGTSDSTDHSGACAALYRNDGDGTFTEVTEASGADFCGIGMAAAWGDYDNDGWPDLVVSAYGRNELYRNEGDGTFTAVTRRAGLARDGRFSAGVAWGDYNLDGWLDLYVTCYVEYSQTRAGGEVQQYETEVPATLNPSSFPPCSNTLYRNEGDGTFRNVTGQLGVGDSEGRSLEAVWADFDSDGRPDLYVANDVSDNVLYRNLAGGGFREVSHRAGVADYRGAMGLAVGDYDLDADLDLFITHWIAQENALYRNLGREYVSGEAESGGNGRGRRAVPGSSADGAPEKLLFADVGSSLGLGQSALDYVGWGTFFFDYDNDTRLDLFVVNGSTLQREEAPGQLVPMDDQIFWNSDRRKGFYEVSPVAGPYFRSRRVGRGAAYADYDRDGDLDVAIINHGGRAALLRNDGGNDGNWLQVRLRGRSSNSDAMGARLRLRAGKTVQVREIGAQGSYLSQSTLVQHFGLGEPGRVDSLTIYWPSGRVRRVTDVRANRRIEIAEEDR